VPHRFVAGLSREGGFHAPLGFESQRLDILTGLTPVFILRIRLGLSQ